MKAVLPILEKDPAEVMEVESSEANSSDKAATLEKLKTVLDTLTKDVIAARANNLPPHTENETELG